ncbi:MAG: hypothetical protein WCK34_17255 [Bacteroidota bacterium]
MKNIILKMVFASIITLALAGFTNVQGQSMYLTVTNNSGLTVDHYVASWTVFSLNPYTVYTCDHYSDPIPSPFSFPTLIPFTANVNDVRDPIFYVYVRVIGYNQFNNPICSGDNTVGPKTTAQLQGSWSIAVTVN